MNWFASDNPRDWTTPRPDLDTLSNQHLWIPATNRVNPEESFIVDMFDEQADLVAVAGEHDSG